MVGVGVVVVVVFDTLSVAPSFASLLYPKVDFAAIVSTTIVFTTISFYLSCIISISRTASQSRGRAGHDFSFDFQFKKDLTGPINLYKLAPNASRAWWCVVLCMS